jgi:hypothetical protein
MPQLDEQGQRVYMIEEVEEEGGAEEATEA